MQKILRNLPAIHEILNSSEIQELLHTYRYDILKKISIQILDEIRLDVKSNYKNYECFTKEMFFNRINYLINFRLNNMSNHSYEKVINATGIAIHTNLGRSPINIDALQKSAILSSSYMNIEYDINNALRYDRNKAVVELIKLLCDCEDAIIVNNNAAALLLIFDTFVKNKNAVISRGELIEIGDRFRLLDIISNTSIIKEVGSTNRTYLKDYENAVDENTSLIIKASKSNYDISGYTEDVSSKKLASLCKEKNIIFVEDLGSGNLIDLSKFGLDYERTVHDAINDKADLVCFSGDKLIGSCQAGIIVGKEKYIKELRKNPIFRALRVGKDTIITLYESLKLYTYNDFENKIPILKIIFSKKEEIYTKAKKLYDLLDKTIFEDIDINESVAYIGGGVSSKPTIESYAISIKLRRIRTADFEKILRTSDNHIIGYIKEDRLYLDMLCVFDEDIDLIAKEINYFKEVIDELDKSDGAIGIFYSNRTI